MKEMEKNEEGGEKYLWRKPYSTLGKTLSKSSFGTKSLKEKSLKSRGEENHSFYSLKHVDYNGVLPLLKTKNKRKLRNLPFLRTSKK